MVRCACCYKLKLFKHDENFKFSINDESFKENCEKNKTNIELINSTNGKIRRWFIYENNHYLISLNFKKFYGLTINISKHINKEKGEKLLETFYVNLNEFTMKCSCSCNFLNKEYDNNVTRRGFIEEIDRIVVSFLKNYKERTYFKGHPYYFYNNITDHCMVYIPSNYVYLMHLLLCNSKYDYKIQVGIKCNEQEENETIDFEHSLAICKRLHPLVKSMITEGKCLPIIIDTANPYRKFTRNSEEPKSNHNDINEIDGFNLVSSIGFIISYIRNTVEKDFSNFATYNLYDEIFLRSEMFKFMNE